MVSLVLDRTQTVWCNAAHPTLQNKHKELSWIVAHKIVQVRAVMHFRGMPQSPICPWFGCGMPETMRHVFWECGDARDLRVMTSSLQCPSLSVGEVLTLKYWLVVYGVGQGIERSPAEKFIKLWITFNSVKDAIKTSRNLLVGKHVMASLHATTQLVTSMLQRYATCCHSEKGARVTRRKVPVATNAERP